MSFSIVDIEFSQSGSIVRFEFGGLYRIVKTLSAGPDLEEAIAIAAEGAAVDLKRWAQDAEDFAAAARAGALRKPASPP